MVIEIDEDVYFDSDVYGLIEMMENPNVMYYPQIGASRDETTSAAMYMFGEMIERTDDGESEQADAAFKTKDMR